MDSLTFSLFVYFLLPFFLLLLLFIFLPSFCLCLPFHDDNDDVSNQNFNHNNDIQNHNDVVLNTACEGKRK